MIGLRCKDGVVLACENIVISKLHEPNNTKHIFTVDGKLGVVRCPSPPTAHVF
jgi:20S proteasome alpha/beta subunit